jgi:hypothetical protein
MDTTLVDDDRLRWHNLVRHQCTRGSVGKYKVDAVAEAIKGRWPAAEVKALRLNVISDADMMRPLFRRCSLVLCAARRGHAQARGQPSGPPRREDGSARLRPPGWRIRRGHPPEAMAGAGLPALPAGTPDK